MKRHELKCWPQYFQPMILGEKLFDIRYNDRDYAVGDELRHREWNPLTKEYTGAVSVCEVKYILKVFLPGLNPNFIIMSIKLKKEAGQSTENGTVPERENES